MKERKQNMKRVFALLLGLLVVFSMMPSKAFAANDTAGKTGLGVAGAVKVTITSQANQQFFHAPLVDTDVEAGLAESYGYTDSVKDGVSLLDALVKAHVTKYGAEFTKEKAAEKLAVDGAGNVTRCFGEETDDSGVMINGKLSETAPAATKVSGGDRLEFFRYASAEKKDMYTGFSGSYYTSGNNGIHWAPFTSIKKVGGKAFGFFCWGFNAAQFGAKEEAERLTNATEMNGLRVGIVDGQTGKVTPVEGAVAEGNNALASGIKLTQTEGVCYLTAYNPDAAIIMPLIKVELVEDPSLAVLELYKSQNDFKVRENPLNLTPELQAGKFDGYEVAVSDYLSSVYIYSSFSANPEDPTNEYLGEKLSKTVSSRWSGSFSGGDQAFLQNGYYEVYYNGSIGKVADYKIKANITATLKGLELEGVADRSFDRDETQYHTYIDRDAETTKLKATGYSASYTVKANGKEIANGEEIDLPVTWDGNGHMEVKISVSSSSYAEKIYTVQYEKEPATERPTVLLQPKSADYIQEDKAAALKTKASAGGTVAYQWYSNSANSTEGAAPIAGATGEEYTPSTEKVGTTYYFCRFTNTGKDTENTTDSEIAAVVVDADPTPAATLKNTGSELKKSEYAYAFDKGFVYNAGTAAESIQKISVEVTDPVAEAEYSYQWIRGNASYGPAGTSGMYVGDGKTEITPSTDLSDANNDGWFYICRVSCTFKGKTYRSYAKTGEKTEGGKDVTGVYVFIKADAASKPTFSTQPTGSEDQQVGGRKLRVSVRADKEDGGTLTYQWYVNSKDSNADGTPIEGATNNYYDTPTDKAGTFYYYCVATNSLQGHTSSAASNTAKIVVKDVAAAAAQTLKEAGVAGDGTEAAPYQIQTAAQLQVVQNLVNTGYAFENKYLSLEDDITLPDGWKPMGVTKDGKADIKQGANLYPFSGKLNGKAHTVTVPEGGLPLLGYVKGAEVRNLKIYGTKIAGYGLVNNFEGVGLSGSAIVIDKVTLAEGTSTLKAGLLGANITTNGFAGVSAGFVATIKNCTVEKGVTVGYDGTQSNIGAFAGRMQGTIENCVNHGTVKGKNYVGGIIGSRDNAMGACVVKNCTFDGTVTASGSQAGGIIGGAYVNTTAPNGVRIAVTENTSSGTVTGENCVGGIMGADYYVNQNWGTGSFKLNRFTGTVAATGENAHVGGVIGYLASLNKYDDVAGNYYKSGCGAEKGIGFVQYVDTSCKTHETESGTIYVNTAVELPQYSGFTKKDHNRTDDPLGADAVKLAYSDGQKDPIVIDLKISGEYKTEYVVGEAFSFDGMTVTATYNTGETKELKPGDIQIENFDSSKRGSQEVKLTYEGISAVLTVTVQKPAGSDITVSVKILGDTRHGESGETHTLSQNNLPVWLETKTVTVGNNATVWDTLQKAVEGTDISFTNPDGNYISAVKKGDLTLSELDNGKNSGWMYTLNGKYPEFGVSEQYLENGDVIVFHYTDDYTKEGDKQDPPKEDDKQDPPKEDGKQDPPKEDGKQDPPKEDGKQDPPKEDDKNEPSRPAAGTSVTDSKTGQAYTVNKGGNTVSYEKPKSKKVTKVTVPATVSVDGKSYQVTAIDANAFSGCTKLKTVTIGKNVTSIGTKAFSGCKKLTKVTIPGKVKTIGSQAFSGCAELKSVTIGKAVTNIGKKAFSGCKKLKSITIKTTKLTSKKVGAGAFKGINAKTTVKVPKGKKAAYTKMLKAKGIGKKVKIK